MRRAKPAWFGHRRGDDDRGYGRVTAPERYRIVTDAAFGLIDELVDVLGATRQDRAVTPGELGGAQAAGDAIEVVAANGARIVIIPTSFPGVLVGIDAEPPRAFPACGCDACQEDPVALAAQLRSEILAAAGLDDHPTV